MRDIRELALVMIASVLNDDSEETNKLEQIENIVKRFGNNTLLPDYVAWNNYELDSILNILETIATYSETITDKVIGLRSSTEFVSGDRECVYILNKAGAISLLVPEIKEKLEGLK